MKTLLDPFPPSDAKPGDTHGTITLCADGVWRDRTTMPDYLLNQVWNHMHGQNMDGRLREWDDHERCAENWNKLSDAIGVYLSKDET